MKALTLRHIPQDIFQILLIEQCKEKLTKHKGQFGLEQTIYKIIREFDRGKKKEQDEVKPVCNNIQPLPINH